MRSAIKQILDERARQDEKWGEQNHHPIGWIAIAAEELGEAAKEALEQHYQSYRIELIQVAAVAVAAIESLDRGKWLGEEPDDEAR